MYAYAVPQQPNSMPPPAPYPNQPVNYSTPPPAYIPQGQPCQYQPYPPQPYPQVYQQYPPQVVAQETYAQPQKDAEDGGEKCCLIACCTCLFATLCAACLMGGGSRGYRGRYHHRLPRRRFHHGPPRRGPMRRRFCTRCKYKICLLYTSPSPRD
eukprot:TRINITY_DN1977_c0_g1_i11.p2 TRINITY_DN1977_c0_g1~~TRINITY_DN1977_c0_g1_i11.p2  ORF type:complete len:154 (-),score=15.86 TRINITY_DN1977_c0_g1_i11:57-518(-)